MRIRDASGRERTLIVEPEMGAGLAALARWEAECAAADHEEAAAISRNETVLRCDPAHLRAPSSELRPWYDRR